MASLLLVWRIIKVKIIKIPQGVDAPPQFLLWQADELIAPLAGMVFGVVIGQVLLCTFGGLLLVNTYRKLRDGQPDGFVFHYLYWRGFGYSKGYSLVNPFVRLWIG